MSYRQQPMVTFDVKLSNGKIAKVTAPSSQRAYARMEKFIADKGSKVTIVSVDQVR